MQTSYSIKGNNLPGIKQLAWVVCILGLVIIARIFYVNSTLFKSWTPYLSANQDLSFLLIMASIYMLFLSIPFLPGIELGLLLMFLVGTKMIIIVYFFTVLGLTLSFLLGRCLPLQGVQFLFRKQDLSLMKYQKMPNLINTQTEKLLGKRFTNYIKKYPCMVVALLLNLPGNFILGGGGGIALLSGLNPSVSLKHFVITVALATLPFPLLVLLGFIQLEHFL